MAPLESVEDFKNLLNALRIKLPENVLNEEVIGKSREFNTDAENIRCELERTELQIVPKPRLQCGEVKRAYSKMKENNVQEFTKMIFFSDQDDNQETLQQRWGRMDQSGFKMKDSYRESPTGAPAGSPEGREFSAGGGVRSKEEKRNINQENERKCLEFFLREIGLSDSDVDITKQHMVELGFLSGRMDYLIKKRGTSERIILECKGTGGAMEEKVFLKPARGHEAELITDHQHYYQTQAYLYILKKTQSDAAPVRAAMVIGVRQEHAEDPEFYYNYVNEDMRKIEELHDYCIEKALPLYLAVLNQIFEKVE